MFKREHTPEERFWKYVNKTDGCWLWTGSVHPRNGYGFFWGDGRRTSAHRFSYELHFGPIPPGMDVCHTCDRPACCRPEHLWVGTRAENMADANRKGRTARGDDFPPRYGEYQGGSKLTDDQVLEIRRLYATGDYSQSMLGRQFGVCQATISSVVRYESWKHLAGNAITVPWHYHRGEAHPKAKLKASQVLEIRRLYATGAFTQVALARQFNVTKYHILDIVRRRTWTHLP